MISKYSSNLSFALQLEREKNKGYLRKTKRGPPLQWEASEKTVQKLLNYKPIISLETCKKHGGKVVNLSTYMLKRLN